MYLLKGLHLPVFLSSSGIFTSSTTDSLTASAPFVHLDQTEIYNITLTHFQWIHNGVSNPEKCFLDYKTAAEDVKFWCQSLIRENKAAVPPLPEKQWREIMIMEMDVNLSAISGLLRLRVKSLFLSPFKRNGVCLRVLCCCWNELQRAWLQREGRRQHKPPLSHFSSYSGRKPPAKLSPPGNCHHSINPIQRQARWGKRATRAAALGHLTRLGSNAWLRLRHPRDLRGPRACWGAERST